MSKEQPDYLSYLLRQWWDNDDGIVQRENKDVVWRASLENSLTGKRQGFDSLGKLFTFLRQATGMAFDGAEKACDV